MRAGGRAGAITGLLFAVLAGSGAARADDEVIDDPMLHAERPAPPAPRQPLEAPRVWRAVVVSRAATQTSWDDVPGGPKDVVEWRTRAELSAGQKVSEHFKWELGARFDALVHAPKSHAHVLGEAAYEFEARPWEAYVDGGIGDQLRIKIGNQIISWGRLDVGSAADVLSPYDLREGPAIDIDALRMPTPTALVTWFPVDAFQLDAGYTPFFVPHRFDVAGTNYALLGPNAPAGVAQVLGKLRGQLDPSSYVRLTDALSSVNGPTARPDNGEAAARATWRAGPYDLAVTYGFVRSKLPGIDFAPALAHLLVAQTPGDQLAAAAQVGALVQNGTPIVAAHYDRYHQVALDLEGTAGSFTVAGEVGLSPSRTLFARDPTTGLPIGVSTGLAQSGLKATWAHEDTTTLTAEASVFVATDAAPPAASGQTQTYYVLGAHRRLFVGFVAGHHAMGRHRLDLALLGTSSGPSLSVIPRYGFQVTEPLVLGAGAALFGGPRGDDGSLAAAQRGLDQVFVFVDWRP